MLAGARCEFQEGMKRIAATIPNGKARLERYRAWTSLLWGSRRSSSECAAPPVPKGDLESL